MKKFELFILLCIFVNTNSQFAGSSDRTQQELNFLNWATGIRMAYCQATPIADLIDPFKEAVARMINRFCRNATACRLKKFVTFTKYQVVILDGFPRRENRGLNFRFFVVFPHDAIPLDKRIEKPLITQKILSDILQTQISELTHGLGWQVLNHERYPHFDPMTTFMNRTLVFILPISILCMIFLAYWLSSITSGNPLYSGGGWMVSGSTGGKNAALRRTLEIIEEQKYRFDANHRQSLYSAESISNNKNKPTTVVVYKSNARLQQSVAPPRSLATSSTAPNLAQAQRAALLPVRNDKNCRSGNKSVQSKASNNATLNNSPFISSRSESTSETASITNRRKSTLTTASSLIGTNDNVSGITPSSVTTQILRNGGLTGPSSAIGMTSYNENGFPIGEEASEMMDVVPELVVVNTRNSSMETSDTYATNERKVSVQSHRRFSRRFSSMDDCKRKKPVFGGNSSSNNGSRNQKRWKAGNLMFSHLSLRRPK